jgi:hypothetical protein
MVGDQDVDVDDVGASTDHDRLGGRLGGRW